jgi:hypothetical protein
MPEPVPAVLVAAALLLADANDDADRLASALRPFAAVSDVAVIALAGHDVRAAQRVTVEYEGYDR